MVVGVDGSEEARAALTWAAAEIGDGELFAVYGLSQWAELAWASIQVNPSLILGEASSLLRDAWCEPADEAGVTCERVTHEDEPATALLTVAEKVDADLIAVGSHSHTRWTPHYLGSVASKLLHRSRRPVAIVPRPHDPAESRGDIVVGVDGSEASRAALAWAIEQAAATGRRVRAVWVVNQLMFYASAWAPGGGHPPGRGGREGGPGRARRPRARRRRLSRRGGPGRPLRRSGGETDRRVTRLGHVGPRDRSSPSTCQSSSSVRSPAAAPPRACALSCSYRPPSTRPRAA